MLLAGEVGDSFRIDLDRQGGWTFIGQFPPFPAAILTRPPHLNPLLYSITRHC
jgi:hypothetical protein